MQLRAWSAATRILTATASATAMLFAANQLDAAYLNHRSPQQKTADQQFRIQNLSPESSEQVSEKYLGPEGANIDLLRIQAEEGNVEAMYQLGKFFLSEDGGKNHFEAYRLFDRAAKQGSDKAKFAAMVIRSFGGQHHVSSTANKENFDLENCPDKESNGEYVQTFSNYENENDRLNEWPTSFEYFVIPDDRVKAEQEARKLFDAAEEIRARRLKEALARGDTQALVGGILGSSEEQRLTQRAADLQRQAESGIDFVATYLQKAKEERPIATCILSDFDGNLIENAESYKLRSICVNNSLKKVFDPSMGIVVEVDSSGNIGPTKTYQGTGVASDTFLLQDKSGNSFLPNDPISIADIIKGNIIDLSSELFVSGKNGVPGQVFRFGGIEFSRAGEHFIIVFKTVRSGFFCSYKKASSLNF